jgi:hypothetical protein
VETPLQRFKRLELELNELKSDIAEMDKLKNSGETSTITADFNSAELTKQLESLRNQINSSHMQSIGARTNASQLDNTAKKSEQLTRIFSSCNLS